MKNKELIIVTGVGFGEESKGGTVEWLTWKLLAHTVIRSGGCQSGHHITTTDGREQAFTHFGAGTFEGARTHLRHMVISPVDLFNEALEIESKGVKNPLDLITVSDRCLVTTPYHSNLSRLREILRGANKKGTVGKGVGEAIIDSRSRPELAIHAGEYRKNETELKEKLERIRQYKLAQAQELVAQFKSPLPTDAQTELNHLKNSSAGEQAAEALVFLGDLVKIVGDAHLDALMERPGVIINESDHGVLHHPRMGFLPHITQVDPTSEELLKDFRNRPYEGRISRYGVTRCYMTRFGAGPLVSFDPEMTARISDKNNSDNPWLGPFRVGAFDPVAIRYALEICGGPSAFAGLMISHLDHLERAASWPVCESYELAGRANDLSDFFEIQKGLIVGIKKYPDTNDEKQRQHQLRLTELIKQCRPIISEIKPIGKLSLEQALLDYAEKKLQVPVVATSHGPTKRDKALRGDHKLR